MDFPHTIIPSRIALDEEPHVQLENNEEGSEGDQYRADSDVQRSLVLWAAVVWLVAWRWLGGGHLGGIDWLGGHCVYVWRS